MTTIVRRRWHCRMSSNLLGLAAVGIAVVAGCTSEETALQPVDTDRRGDHVRNLQAGQAAETGDGERRIRRVRERAGPAAGAVARRTLPVRGQHAGQPARDLPGHRPPLASAGVGAGRPRAGRRRGAQRRARSGSSTTSPTASASSTSSSRTSAARRAHAARRRRAARHRLRRARQRRAPSSPPRTAARTPALRSAAHHAGRRPRRRLGLRRRPPRRRRSAARRSPSSPSSPTRRARSRSRPTAARSTRPASTPATGPRRVARARSCPNGGEAAGGLPGPNTNAQGVAAAAEVGLIVKYERRSTGSTSSAAPGTTSVRFSLPDKDVFAIDATPTRRRSSPAPAGFYRASARSCSTWRSTR